MNGDYTVMLFFKHISEYKNLYNFTLLLYHRNFDRFAFLTGF